MESAVAFAAEGLYLRGAVLQTNLRKGHFYRSVLCPHAIEYRWCEALAKHGANRLELSLQGQNGCDVANKP